MQTSTAIPARLVGPSWRTTAVIALSAGVAASAILAILRINIVLNVATSLAIASCVVALRGPEVGIVLFFAWFPLADLIKRLLFLQAGSGVSQIAYFWALGLPDAVLGVTFVGALVYSLKRRRLAFRVGWADLLVGGYALWTIVTAANPTFSPLVRLVGLKSITLYMGLYFLVRILDAEDTRWLVRVRGVVYVVAALASVYAIVQATVGLQPFERQWLSSGLTELGGGGGELGGGINLFGILRPFSIFASHEQLGWYLGFAMLLVLGLPKSPWLDWPVVLLGSLALARTLSRSAWVYYGLALAAMLILSLLANERKMARRAASAALIFLLSIGFWFMAQGVVSDEASNGATAEPSGPSIMATAEPSGPSIMATAEPSGPSIMATAEPSNGPSIVATADSSNGPSIVATAGPSNAPSIVATAEPSNGPTIGTSDAGLGAYGTRATTLGTYEWRLFSFHEMLYEPSWHTLFGNGVGSMWIAWRLHAPGTTNPPSLAEKTPGTRILSHVGVVDILYESGIVGTLLYLAAVGTVVAQGLIGVVRKQGRDPGIRSTSLASIGALNAANSFVTTVLMLRPIAAPYWMMLGLAVSRSGQPRIGPVDKSPDSHSDQTTARVA